MKVQLLMDGVVRSISLEAGEREGSFTGEIDGKPVQFDAVVIEPGVVSLLLYAPGGAPRAYRCVLDADGPENKTVSIGRHSFPYQVHDPRSLATRRKRPGVQEGTQLLSATMAGRVVRILVEEGSDVAAHEGVIVIEAMKMQNELRSLRAGRVMELRVATGEMVSAGQVLAVIE